MNSLLSRDEVLSAAFDLYCVSVDDRWDQLHWKRPRDWSEFQDEIRQSDEESGRGPSDADLLEVMWRILGRVEQAWGFDIGLVWHHAGLLNSPYRDTTHASRALYYLVMGCMGHGVSLVDDYDDALTQASLILRAYKAPFPHAPIFIDDPFSDLAYNAYPDPVGAMIDDGDGDYEEENS